MQGEQVVEGGSGAAVRGVDRGEVGKRGTAAVLEDRGAQRSDVLEAETPFEEGGDRLLVGGVEHGTGVAAHRRGAAGEVERRIARGVRWLEFEAAEEQRVEAL